MNQQEYEHEQERFLRQIELAHNALLVAESNGSSFRVRMNREDALRQANEAYDRFMERDWTADRVKSQ